MIEMNCPSCGYGLRIDDSYAGKRGQCKQCGGVVEVPALVFDTSPTAPRWRRRLFKVAVVFVALAILSAAAFASLIVYGIRSGNPLTQEWAESYDKAFGTAYSDAKQREIAEREEIVALAQSLSEDIARREAKEAAWAEKIKEEAEILAQEWRIDDGQNDWREQGIQTLISTGALMAVNLGEDRIPRVDVTVKFCRMPEAEQVSVAEHLLRLYLSRYNSRPIVFFYYATDTYASYSVYGWDADHEHTCR